MHKSPRGLRFGSCGVIPAQDLQNCDFAGVVFADCTFLHTLVKTCIFDRCEFVGCHANNKLFETCRFIDCTFRATEIQVQTVAENFGITSSGYEGRLRRDRVEVSNTTLSGEDLLRWVSEADVHPIHKLNIEYFVSETFVSGSATLDRCLRIGSWLPQFRTAKSFLAVLTQWVEFLLWLYRRDRITVYVILAAHSMIGEILSALRSEPQHQPVSISLSGAYLSLARLVDQFLEMSERCAEHYRNGISLLVEGSGEKKYYTQKLAPLLANAQIESVKPHNSPWEILMSFGPGHEVFLFMAYLLATRTHIELSRVRQAAEPKPPGDKKRGSSTAVVRRAPAPSPVLSLEFGMARPSTAAPNLRLRAYLPGNLLAELRINVGSRQIGKLRKTIKGVL